MHGMVETDGVHHDPDVLDALLGWTAGRTQDRTDPVPGLSNMTSRANDVIRRSMAFAWGSVHSSDMWERIPLDEHDVDRPVADHLVGDADLALLGVLRLRCHRVPPGACGAGKAGRPCEEDRVLDAHRRALLGHGNRMAARGPGVRAATSGETSLTGRASVRPSPVTAIEVPLVRDALERVRAAIEELDAGPEHQLSDRARTPAPRRPRQCPTIRAATLTAIPARSSPRRSHSPVWIPARISIPSGPDGIAHGARCADGFGRPVEHGKEPVPEGLDGPAAVALELRSDDLVVALDQRPPSLVADVRGSLGRRDDVGEQDRWPARGRGRTGGARRSGTPRSRRSSAPSPRPRSDGPGQPARRTSLPGSPPAICRLKRPG